MLKKAKRRYLALVVESSEAVDSKDLMDALWHSVTKLFGEYGASQAGLTLISCDMDGKSAVVRCSLVALEMVRTAIALIIKIGEKPAAIHVARVSGTIRALQQKTNQRNPSSSE